MNNQVKIVDCPLVSGQVMTFETGLMAQQAGGAVVVRLGDTVVIATATASSEPREGCDFFPLTVDYFAKTYSAGKIPGGFFKREGRQTAHEILTCRLIDRPLRPQFPDGYINDVQIICFVLSYDQENQPDIMAMNAASAALLISDIPFAEPVAAVRVGKVDGQLVLNPSVKAIASSCLDMIVAGTEQAIAMVESGSNEISEEAYVEALGFAHAEIKKLCQAQRKLVAQAGKTKIAVAPVARDASLVATVRDSAVGGIREALNTAEKAARKAKFKATSQAVAQKLIAEKGDEGYLKIKKQVHAIIEDLIMTEMRGMILSQSRRVDGRGLRDIRQIDCLTGLLPRTHGSALFTRGQTQSLGVCTLGAVADQQIIDGIDDEYRKRFILHYNFPPLSTGEVKMMRGPGRREIGHGALAERSLIPMMPPADVFPYTVRIVSEILSSNGSSSMASVCSGSLAMMDAGVPLKAPVAGIAMGLIKEGDNYKVLSDILGDEDHFGDMDFKVAGTTKGVTALQMDIKIAGVTLDIMRNALEQAREGRMHILGKMGEALAAPRPELSKYAPRILSMDIDPDKIRNVIGPGGKMIRKIQEETGVKIDIDDSGKVLIMSPDLEASKRAQLMVQRITEEAEVGKTYTGKVKRIMKFGAFVEILPGIEGLVHISQLAHTRVNIVEDVCNIGDEVTVKVVEIDQMGRVNLSRKCLLEMPAGMTAEAGGTGGGGNDGPPRPPREGGGYRDGPPRRDGGGGDRGPRRDGGGDRGPRRDR